MKMAWLYITAGTYDEVRTIGRTLVEERLAACVNILGPIDSIFWWESEVKSESEVAFIVKTRTALVEEIVARITELHSYQCPFVISLPIETGISDYLDWIKAETKS